MGGCRETANLWFWLRHDPIRFIKWKMWQEEYFWQDSFWRYCNRLIGCRKNKHKDLQWLDEGCDNPDSHWYCFACQREVN